MNVGMLLVSMQSHHVAMLKSKLLPTEVSDRTEHLIRWRPGGHREHEFMDESRRLLSLRCGKFRLAPVFVQVEIPVFDEVFRRALTPNLVAVVSLQLEVAAANVLDVLTHCLETGSTLG